MHNRSWNSFITLGITATLVIAGPFGCSDDNGDDDQADDDTGGDGDGDPTTGDGDGDPTTGDGDGDPTTGDGDGDPTTGDGDGDGDPTTGDGDGDPTTGDGDGDPGCTDLGGDYPGVTAQFGEGVYPTAEGGTITDGTYVLTEWHIYPPGNELPPGERVGALRFTGNMIEDYELGVLEGKGTFVDGQDPPDPYPPGTMVDFTYECPVMGGYSKLYTVTPTQYIWFEIQDDKNELWIYTKQ